MAVRWAAVNWKGIPTEEFKQDTYAWTWSYIKLEKKKNKRDVQTINSHTGFAGDELEAKAGRNKIFFLQFN